MKPYRSLAAALALCALAAAKTVSAHAALQSAQDDPFEKLKSYDFQARAPIEAIRLMIDQAVQTKSPTVEIETKLDGVLDDPNATFAGKQEAARLLWIVGTARSVPSLAKLLKDDKTADMARYALERDRDPSAARALRTALETATGNTMVGVINSLGDRGDAEAAGVLYRLVSSPDPLVAEAAVAALGKIGTSPAISVLRGLPLSNISAGRALVRAAVHQVSSGNMAVGVKLLGVCYGSTRPDLVRGEALRELVLVFPTVGAQPALGALKSPDPYIQEIAARLCGASTVPGIAPKAINAWPTLPVPTQVILLTALADRGALSAAPLALAAMKSTDPELRQTGIRAAGRIGGRAAVTPLVDVMIHGEGGDRDLARDSLAAMAGPEADKAILELSKSGSPEVQAGLMRVLAQRPTPAVIAALTASAGSSDSHTAVEAIRALRQVGGAAEELVLIKLVTTTSSDDIRDAAKDGAVAIAKRSGAADDGAAPILAALPSATGPSAAALVTALAEIGGDHAFTALTQDVNSADAGIRQAAISGLSDTWSDTRPLATLLYIAKNDSSKEIRIQALRGYLRIVGQDEGMRGQQRFEDVDQAMAAAQRPEEKRQALSVLRDARVSGAVELAARQLDDPATFNEAADTVLYLASKQRKNNRDEAAVVGSTTNEALDKIIEMTKDDGQRAQAQKLKS